MKNSRSKIQKKTIFLFKSKWKNHASETDPTTTNATISVTLQTYSGTSFIH